MRISWRVLRGLVVPFVVLGPIRAQEARRLPQGLAEVAAAYAAKVAATALFVSGRSLDSVLAEELAPDSPMQALVRQLLHLDVDREQRTCTATILGTKATAAFVDGLGCTLLHGADLAEVRRRALPPPPPGAADGRPWPLGDAPPDGKPPADVDPVALDAAVGFAFTDAAGPKARTRAVVVVRDGRLLAERYAPGYDARTPLPGWSMTKSLVDALVGLRVGDGALDPDAPLPVPEWSKDGDPRRALRLEHLLRMESGLAWTEDYEDPGSDALRMLFTATDYGGVAAGKDLVAAPGSARRYSSGTTNLLCRILRATFRTDAAYLAFPRDRLFLPLGMRSALIETDPTGTFVGSSFGVATGRDWARFGLFYLQDGVWDGRRLLPAGWVRDSLAPSKVAPNFGRHWYGNRGEPGAPEKRPFPTLPSDLFYMSGYEGQYVFCFPAQRLVVVRLGCTRRGGFALREFLERVLRASGR